MKREKHNPIWFKLKVEFEPGIELLCDMPISRLDSKEEFLEMWDLVFKKLKADKRLSKILDSKELDPIFRKDRGGAKNVR